MGTDLGYVVFINNHNPVRTSQRGQTMHSKGGTALRQTAESLLNLVFRFGIQCACCLVQDQQTRIVQNRPAMATRCRSPPDRL